MGHFKEVQNVEKNNGSLAVQFSPNEKRALSFVDAFSRLQDLNEEEQKTLKLAKQAIVDHRFQKLQREINTLRKTTEKTKMKPVFVAEKLLKILSQYPLQNERGNIELQPIKHPEPIDPEIIISESFH